MFLPRPPLKMIVRSTLRNYSGITLVYRPSLLQRQSANPAFQLSILSVKHDLISNMDGAFSSWSDVGINKCKDNKYWYYICIFPATNVTSPDGIFLGSYRSAVLSVMLTPIFLTSQKALLLTPSCFHCPIPMIYCLYSLIHSWHLAA